MISMIKKLKDFYDVNEFPYLSVSMIDFPLLKAVSDCVEELELTKEEFLLVMQYGISNSLYYYTQTADSGSYHSVLGIKLKVI